MYVSSNTFQTLFVFDADTGLLFLVVNCFVCYCSVCQNCF